MMQHAVIWKRLTVPWRRRRVPATQRSQIIYQILWPDIRDCSMRHHHPLLHSLHPSLLQTFVHSDNGEIICSGMLRQRHIVTFWSRSNPTRTTNRRCAKSWPGWSRLWVRYQLFCGGQYSQAAAYSDQNPWTSAENRDPTSQPQGLLRSLPNGRLQEVRMCFKD